jgi:hypothetical protein
MTPLAVFIRTLLRTSAIFIGTTMVFLHPPSEWAGGRTVSAVPAGREMAVDALIAVMNDSDAGVRRQVAASLGTSANPRALPALRMMLHDAEPAVRRAALSSINKIERRVVAQAFRPAGSDGAQPAEALAKAGGH